MTILELKDGSVELDEDGYLKDFSQWSEEVAQALAERDGIELTEEHLKVIRMIQAYYQEAQRGPHSDLGIQGMRHVIQGTTRTVPEAAWQACGQARGTAQGQRVHMNRPRRHASRPESRIRLRTALRKELRP